MMSSLRDITGDSMSAATPGRTLSPAPPFNVTATEKDSITLASVHIPRPALESLLIKKAIATVLIPVSGSVQVVGTVVKTGATVQAMKLVVVPTMVTKASLDLDTFSPSETHQDYLVINQNVYSL